MVLTLPETMDVLEYMAPRLNRIASHRQESNKSGHDFRAFRPRSVANATHSLHSKIHLSVSIGGKVGKVLSLRLRNEHSRPVSQLMYV